jgi:hypothetical protein
MFAGAALATTLAFASGTARAALDVGEVAPAFEGKEFVNTEEVTLKKLRGKVVLYEVFRTW